MVGVTLDRIRTSPPKDYKESGPMTVESHTGVEMPNDLEGYVLVGTGCRWKYMLVKVYAVGVYMKKEDFKGLTKAEALKALMDHKFHRVFRLVLVRTVTASQYLNGCCASLEPYMRDEDLDILALIKANPNKQGSLKKFSKLYIFVNGSELTMWFQDEFCYEIESLAMAKAAIQSYFSEHCVSPTLRFSVIENVEKLIH